MFEALTETVGFVMLSIRIVNLVGLSSPPEAIPATLKITPAVTLNNFVYTFLTSFVDLILMLTSQPYI